MAGLPGAGKSAVAEDVAAALPAAILSVDPIEAAMWAAGVARSQPTGVAAYVVAEVLAGEQLAIGRPVVVDAVNAVEPARAQWRGLAARARVPLVFVEVYCGDPDEHRRRLESRRRSIPGFPEPTWESVLARRAAFADWSEPRLRLDSLDTRAANLATALAHLAQHRPDGRGRPTRSDDDQ